MGERNLYVFIPDGKKLKEMEGREGTYKVSLIFRPYPIPFCFGAAKVINQMVSCYNNFSTVTLNWTGEVDSKISNRQLIVFFLSYDSLHATQNI